MWLCLWRFCVATPREIEYHLKIERKQKQKQQQNCIHFWTLTKENPRKTTRKSNEMPKTESEIEKIADCNMAQREETSCVDQIAAKWVGQSVKVSSKNIRTLIYSTLWKFHTQTYTPVHMLTTILTYLVHLF